MEKRHPISRDTVQPRFQSVDDIERRGLSWQSASLEYLVGYTSVFGGNDAGSQMPAVTEMQRRLYLAIEDFNVQSTRRARTTIRLTGGIIGLTVVLGIIAALQLWAMLRG